MTDGLILATFEGSCEESRLSDEELWESRTQHDLLTNDDTQVRIVLTKSGDDEGFCCSTSTISTPAGPLVATPPPPT